MSGTANNKHRSSVEIVADRIVELRIRQLDELAAQLAIEQPEVAAALARSLTKKLAEVGS
jgi:hypothetical protein